MTTLNIDLTDEAPSSSLGGCVSQTIALLMQPRQLKVKGLCARAGVVYNSFRERYNAGTITIEDLARIAPVLDTTPARIMERAQDLHYVHNANQGRELTVIEGGGRRSARGRVPLLRVCD